MTSLSPQEAAEHMRTYQGAVLGFVRKKTHNKVLLSSAHHLVPLLAARTLPTPTSSPLDGAQEKLSYYRMLFSTPLPI